MAEDLGVWEEDDFDLEAGFSEAVGNKDPWEGEDEGVKIEEEEEAKMKVEPNSGNWVTVERKSKQQRIREKKAKRREQELESKLEEVIKESVDRLSLDEKLKEEKATKLLICSRDVGVELSRIRSRFWRKRRGS